MSADRTLANDTLKLGPARTLELINEDKPCAGPRAVSQMRRIIEAATDGHISSSRARMWIASICLGVCACVVKLAHASDANTNADIFGRWTVASILDTADIAGMSDRQARQLIGKHLEIGPDALKFSGESCKSPSYSRSVREPVKYLREEWHARSGNLRLPNPVTVIDVRCTELFLTCKGRMVFNWNGFFFGAKKN